MLGLKRGEIFLCNHQMEWDSIAKETIINLKSIFGELAIDIQHIGSTAIKNIKAKPVIDIAVGVKDFEKVLTYNSVLESNGFFFRGYEGKDRQPVYQCGEFSNDINDMIFLTHYIHIVIIDSDNWKNYINFRNYMNCHNAEAKLYETMKLNSIDKVSKSLLNYHQNKQKIVIEIIEKANLWQKTNTTKDLNGLYIVNYCHTNCKPFFNIMRLPKNQAFEKAKELSKQNPETTAFYRFTDFENYYPRRLKADEIIYNKFIMLGGKPKEKHPLSFVLHDNEYLNTWFGNGTVTKILLKVLQKKKTTLLPVVKI